MNARARIAELCRQLSKTVEAMRDVYDEFPELNEEQPVMFEKVIPFSLDEWAIELGIVAQAWSGETHNIDWNDPGERAQLLLDIGVDAYNRAVTAHRTSLIIATINGHAIRQVQSQFGRLFEVGRLGRAFATYAEAIKCATDAAKGGDT